jgi:Xaa-Pro dipeptidase
VEDGSIRVGQIQQAMRDAGLDAVVLRLAENVLLATGWFVRYPGTTLVVVPPEGQAVLIVPEHEAEEAAEVWRAGIAPYPAMRHDVEPAELALGRLLGTLAREIGATGGAVGYEGSFETIAPASFFGEPNAVGLPTQACVRSSFATERLVDVTGALEDLRAVKTEREIDLIRRTNEIAVLGLNAFKRAAVPGATEIEVMAAVEQAIAVQGHGHRGAQWVRGFATVCSGPRLVDGWQYWRAHPRTIEAGDLVMIELGTVADGYWSDHTRTVVAGTATTIAAAAHGAATAALDAALAAARPGATGGAVDAAAREACAARGFTQFPHHTGHGTGFRYHESRPMLEPDAPDRLLEGQIIAVEPGIYGPKLNGGVRHEDDAVVTATGAVRLATTDYGLDGESSA